MTIDHCYIRYGCTCGHVIVHDNCSGATDVINSVQRMRQNARKGSIGDRINPLQCIRANFKDDKL